MSNDENNNHSFCMAFVRSSFAEVVLDESAFTQRYAKAISDLTTT